MDVEIGTDCSRLGDDREFARAYDWRDGIHPDDVERILAESIAGEASGQTFTLEGRFRRGDGEYRWLKSTSSPRFGPDGELVGFIGVATDITLAKEAEIELRRQVEERTHALAESDARFRALFDAVLEVLCLLTPDGTIIEMNSKEASWRAVNADEAIGRKIWDAPTLEAYPQHKPLIKEAARRRGMQPAHYFRRCVLAFVAHDLGIDFLELASLEPPMREKDDLPPRRFGGKGFGKWRIRKLER